MRDNFRRSLEDNLKNVAEIRARTRKRTLILRGLDMTVTETEIRSVLNEELNGELGELGTIRINDRENKTGNKHAFLLLPIGLAIELIKRKKVGKGWTRWRVVSPGRCYLCKRVGHEAKACKGEGEVCHNCGEKGHLKRDCKNEAACYLCKVSGHKAESTSCPILKKSIQELRKKGESPDKI